MNATVFETKKARIAKMILNADDEYAVDQIMEYAEQVLQSSPPCRFSAEELRAEVSEALEDIKAGRVISHEDLVKEIEGW